MSDDTGPDKPEGDARRLLDYESPQPADPARPPFATREQVFWLAQFVTVMAVSHVIDEATDWPVWIMLPVTIALYLISELLKRAFRSDG